MRGTHHMRTPAPAALLAALALSLAACHSDPSSTPPVSSPPTSPATTATPSTTPKPPPPTIPPAATAGLTVTSAEAFARFYLATLDHMSATGDTSTMRRWALPQCSACRGLADSYEKSYRAGGRISGDTSTQVTRIVSVDLVKADKAKVVLEGKVGPTVLIPNRTASPTPLPGGKQHWDFYLGSRSGHWMIFTLNLTE